MRKMSRQFEIKKKITLLLRSKFQLIYRKIINETNFSDCEIWLKNKDFFIDLFNSGLNDISRVIETKDIVKLYNEKKINLNSNNVVNNDPSNSIPNNKNLSNINIILHNEKGVNNQNSDLKEKNILNKSNNRISRYKI
jgi:hypothetical protein